MRTKKLKANSSDVTTIRGKNIGELHKVQDDVAIGTGADRSRRWTDNRVSAPLAGDREGVTLYFLLRMVPRRTTRHQGSTLEPQWTGKDCKNEILRISKFSCTGGHEAEAMSLVVEHT